MNAGYLGRFESGLDVVSGEEGSMDSWPAISTESWRALFSSAVQPAADGQLMAAESLAVADQSRCIPEHHHAARPSSGLRATTPGRFITCV
jgi:hypothetical protein